MGKGKTVLAAAAAAFTLFAAGLALDGTWLSARAADDAAETYKQLNLFGEVFERVRAEYVREVADAELIEAAINGMLTDLDPHSSYLNADKFKDMQIETKGEFGGLGIEVTMEDGLVKVVSPIDETPAEKAGIEPGDFIVQLDGEPVLGLTLAEAVEKMRGPVDTTIRLTISRRDQAPFDVTIIRAIIRINSVRWRVEDNIGYIRITTFNEQIDQGLKEAAQGIRKSLGNKLGGVVLDLRNNPGGLLEKAVFVSDAFLDKGEIVSTRGRNDEDAQRFNAHAGQMFTNVPVVVLINGGSASASEIVAGALQDHGRAMVLGTKSFGKGSVQTIIPLGQHGAMRLTTALYFTPSGRSIQAKGIEPDIEVPNATIELQGAKGRRESDLRGALPNGDGAGAGNKADAPKGEEVEDFQLIRAFDLLKGINLYSLERAN